MATRAATRARKPPTVTVGSLSLTPAQAKQAGVLPAQVLERNQRTAAVLEAIGHGERGLARHLARNVHERSARLDRALELIGALRAVERYGIAVADLDRWPAEAWATLTTIAGLDRPPSEATCAIVADHVKRWWKPAPRPQVRGREVTHAAH